MQKKFNDEINSLKLNQNLFQSQLCEKDEDMLKEKQKSASIQREFDRLQIKFNECNNYISKLPTIDESKEVDMKARLFCLILANNLIE